MMVKPGPNSGNFLSRKTFFGSLAHRAIQGAKKNFRLLNNSFGLAEGWLDEMEHESIKSRMAISRIAKRHDKV